MPCLQIHILKIFILLIAMDQKLLETERTDSDSTEAQSKKKKKKKKNRIEGKFGIYIRSAQRKICFLYLFSCSYGSNYDRKCRQL